MVNFYGTQGSSLGGSMTAGKKKADDEVHPVHQFGYNPYNPSRVSLFGNPKPGLPKTDAMRSAEASYAAGFARSPEALAYNSKVNDLLQAGVNVGYGTYRKDGKLYNNGREITGYGYANEDATTPTFLSGSQSMGGNSSNQAFVMTGENNDIPMFKFGDTLMDVDQYNDWRYRNAVAAAKRQGRDLLPRDPDKGPLSMAASLFGPMYEPEKLTPEQFKAKVEYANRPGRSKKSRLFPGTTPVSSLAYYEPPFAQDGGTFGQSNMSSGLLIDNQTGAPINFNLDANLANYDSYTVNSDLDAAEQSLRDMLVNAQNNNADASTIGRIQMALDDIGRLGQDRTRQQGIIDQARRDAQSNLTNFGTSYTDVDYRNAQALDSLSRQLDQITNPNLDVDLNYDFSDLAGDVDPYREVVQNMRARRMRELNALGEDIGGIDTSLSGFRGEEGQLRDIQSASEVYDIRDRLNEALNSLDVYGVGSRANELRGQIFNQDEIYGQLADQLRGRQGQIETDAQAQLDALAEARLTRPDDIRSFEEALRDLSGQRDLFDAATAADELERLTDQVQRARSDLERDEAARIARQQLERMRALQTQGAAGFNNNYMTADDYSAYLRALEMGRDDQYFEGMGTSFSRALGLA